MKLTINQRPSGATTCHLALTSHEALTLTPRQREDLTLGLALLGAAVRGDDAFLSDNPVGRATEVLAAHELERTAKHLDVLADALATPGNGSRNP